MLAEAKRKTILVVSLVLCALALQPKTRAELSVEDGKFSVERSALESINYVENYDGFSDVALESSVAPNTGVETVQRAMSRAELENIQRTGMLSRGGRQGDHFVSPAANSNANRARQRLGLPRQPEVRVSPKGVSLGIRDSELVEQPRRDYWRCPCAL